MDERDGLQGLMGKLPDQHKELLKSWPHNYEVDGLIKGLMQMS